MSYRPTIGLEIHAELKTQTKMFCDSPNDPDEERPNVNVCPICLAHPGTLPMINKEAVRHILKVGTAIGGTLARDFSEFDRKSYFYPDIPKGYQISQYEHPLVSGGMLVGVPITRVHLEEDTARSVHHSASLTTGAGGASLVDFNRAGIPLMELVTDPAIHDAETAGKFARELQLLLRTLGASDANLEKGEMRIEANISVSSEAGKFGTKVEVKNLNSFRSVERAIAYEIQRQGEVLEKGEKVIQETRGWDEGKQATFSQRLKEGSADYRYFPEPDLPKLVVSDLSEFAPSALKESMPELPDEKRTRYASLGLKSADIEFIISTKERGAFFDATVVALSKDAELVLLAANYLVSDLAGEPEAIEPQSYARVLGMFKQGALSSRGVKDVLTIMKEEGGDPERIAQNRGLMQVSDAGALERAVREVVEAHPGVVADYKGGKEAALQFLVGQAMKATKGAGNPSLIRELLLKAISTPL